MNILTIVVLMVFALCVFGGYKKGFLKTAFSLVSWILVLVLCNFATPIVTEALIEHTEIEVMVQATVEKKVLEAFGQALDNSELSELEASLPAELKAVLLGENESIADVVLDGSVPFDVSPVVNGVVGILGFVVTVIALRVAVLVVEFMLGIVSKLPLIGPMDKILGLGCGAVKGLIWCWVILAVISVLALTGINSELAVYISQSALLTWLQNNNVLLNLIVGV